MQSCRAQVAGRSLPAFVLRNSHVQPLLQTPLPAKFFPCTINLFQSCDSHKYKLAAGRCSKTWAAPSYRPLLKQWLEQKQV